MKAKLLSLSLATLLFSCATTYEIDTPPVKPANPVEMTGELKKAFKTARLDKVSKVLSQRPHLIFSVNKDGQTPLHISAQRGLLDITKYLLKYGADVKAKDVKGQTPLHMALFGGQSATAKLLIKKGADLAVEDQSGNTALHFSAHFFKSDEIFDFYHRAGVKVNINQQNNLGRTALHVAAKNNNKVLVHALLNRQADVNLRDIRNNTALMYAAESHEKNDDLCIALVKAGSPLDTVNKDGNNLLLFSVRRNKPKLFNLAIEKIKDYDAKNNEGHSALHLAVQENNFDLAKILLDKGANINSQDKAGNSVLHSLAFWGDERGAIFLLSYKPKLDLRNDEKRQPVHEFAFWGKEKILKLFIEAGAKIDTRCANGQTPLHLAIRQNKGKVVDLILEQSNAKALLALKNERGFTPLHMALSSFQSSEELIAQLIKAGSDVNTENIYKESPLHDAVKQEKLAWVKVLVDNGAKIEKKDYRGNTALDWAKKRQNHEIIDYLQSKLK